ncbi:mannosyltransferase OCH1-like enzyme [Sphingomonas sp. SORGH_AS870]|uniref:glycosyltransferase family 32 protein n=1 Tax=Sphingomonas sp. SORGH_AS_0870 TaxID=3041801 RepID=UPI0028564BD8|nr:glycosyltransferase [Sphingomonas sp. SORGH_AS_0870]MDR6146382.1 mannosyltransferase OCH1-like enzyme [Sphingomonas sp. SORGH_AS_0870]
MIPKRLHVIWVGDEAKRPDNCIDTWRAMHPDWEFRLWGNQDFSACQWANRAHMDAMWSRELNGVADMMRWEILYHHGGVLVDADSICVRPLDEHLLDCEAFACWESEVARPGLIAAGYFGCKSENPFVGQIIKDIAAETSVTDRMAWQSVGPQRVTDAYRAYGYNRLRIYPSHYFIPEHFTGIAYDGSDPVYAYQLWGSTRGAYDVIHQHALVSAAPVPAPQPEAPVAVHDPDLEQGLFHRVWFGDKPIPPHYEAYWAAWQRQFPDARFITWTDADVAKLTMSREKIEAVSVLPMRADIARYEILYRFGGICLDCDVMPHRHFDPAEMSRTLTVCNEDASTDYCSIGFIGAPKGHAIFRELLDHIMSHDLDETRVNISTGPWLFGAFLKRHAHCRLGTEAFYPYLYDQPLASLRRRTLENTYGIHVWGGSWLPEQVRKDKAMDLLRKGDLEEPAAILAGYDDEWSQDVSILIQGMREIRTGSVGMAAILQPDMSIDADDRLAFEFGKVAAWLFDRDGGHMVWRIGASEGTSVDPLRPVMVNYDPPAVLLEPDAHRFAALERGYRNNRNAMFLPFGYETGEGRVYAVDPITVAAPGLPQAVGASPVRNGKKGINGKTGMIQGSSCIEKTAAPVDTYQDMLAKTGGRAADILVVDAGGMDRAIILDILGHGASPMVLHFETRRLDADEQHALLAALEGDYVVLRFGDAMTAYRIDVIKDYARALYIEHGMPTIYSAGLKMLNGL